MHCPHLDSFLLLLLSDALFRCKIPLGLDAPDVDAPDAFY